MVAPCDRPGRRQAVSAWQAPFLAMLPTITQYARVAFRGLRPEAREDAVQEVVANSLVAFARLVERGKADLAYPTVLARYGIAQVRTGRRVGGHLRIGDVLSEYAQRRKGFTVERLDRYDDEEQAWIEAVVPDDRRPVPDQAAFRLDFPAWLATLSGRNRRIARLLATGCGTGEAARRFRVSPGRISQLRRQFHRSWTEFQGEPASRGA